MSTLRTFISLAMVSAIGASTSTSVDLRLPVEVYLDKMKGGWIGQMAGVGLGGPTEFKWQGVIVPEEKVPSWKPEMVNQFAQDDIYVEITFLRTLERHGLDVTAKQAGIDFANSGYWLWHANMEARNNLRDGIAPPDSGHPHFNEHSDDIDYQIEADFAGLISPGMPNMAIGFGEKFGRIMNYGDGIYGGQFIAGMYAAAFFEDDVEKIVRSGLQCIPEQSQYAECVRDVLTWHAANPDDWEKTWRLVDGKYQKNSEYRLFSCRGSAADFNIDAKLNGAYVVMGLLYGQGDIDKTIVVATRCGMDSDCNPSSAAGILGTSIGFSHLPDEYKSALDETREFSYTPYDFPALIEVCEKLAKEIVVRAGGSIEARSPEGEEFIIPLETPQPNALERSWAPGPISGSRYSAEEMTEIRGFAPPKLFSGLKEFAPGWQIAHCGNSNGPDEPGLYEEKAGRENVFVTHPMGNESACVLSKEVDILSDRETVLNLAVGHHPKGDWLLLIRVNGAEVQRRVIGEFTCENGWKEMHYDLSEYAGQRIALELVDHANGRLTQKVDAAYWGAIEIVAE